MSLLPGWKLRSYKTGQPIYAKDWENEFNQLLKAYNVGQNAWFGGHFFPGTVEINFVSQYILLPPQVIENFQFVLEWIWLYVPVGSITVQLVLNGIPQPVFATDTGMVEINPGIPLDPDDEIHFIVTDASGDPEDVSLQAGGCNKPIDEEMEEVSAGVSTKFYLAGTAQLVRDIGALGTPDFGSNAPDITGDETEILALRFTYVLPSNMQFSGHVDNGFRVRLRLGKLGVTNGGLPVTGSLRADLTIVDGSPTGSPGALPIEEEDVTVLGYIQSRSDNLVSSSANTWASSDVGDYVVTDTTWEDVSEVISGVAGNVLVLDLYINNPGFNGGGGEVLFIVLGGDEAGHTDGQEIPTGVTANFTLGFIELSLVE